MTDELMEGQLLLLQGWQKVDGKKSLLLEPCTSSTESQPVSTTIKYFSDIQRRNP
jgi:hypothetical protein